MEPRRLLLVVLAAAVGGCGSTGATGNDAAAGGSGASGVTGGSGAGGVTGGGGAGGAGGVGGASGGGGVSGASGSGVGGGNVSVSVGATEVPRDTTGVNGWNYADAANLEVRVYGSWCNTIMTSGSTAVRIVYGCASGGGGTGG